MINKNGIVILPPAIRKAKPGTRVADEPVSFERKAISKTHRLLRTREEGRCWYCGRLVPADKATVDHQIPISAGGNGKLSNIVYCCFRCNQEKDDATVSRYRMNKTQNYRYLFWGEQGDRPQARREFDEANSPGFREYLRIGEAYEKTADNPAASNSADQSTDKERQEEIRGDP